jgi:signal peptidase
MSWVGRISAWLVILGVGSGVLIAVLVPRVAGATPYVVLTDSMRPAMPPGTLVVVKPVSPTDIGIGSVVTYQLRSGEPTVVTHRVVAVGIDEDGDRIFRTQGDANDTPDAGWVRAVQIRGERWYSVPYLGHLSNVITNEQRQVALFSVVMLLLGYAAVMFVGSYRDARKPTATHAGGRGA